MPVTFDKLFEAADGFIRAGKRAKARQLFEGALKRKIPPAERVRLASLARRLELPHIGLRLLAPQVRPSRFSAAQPTEAELAEYAANLVRHGAVEENLGGRARG